MGNKARCRGNSPFQAAFCKGKGAVGQNDRLERITSVEDTRFKSDTRVGEDDGFKREAIFKQKFFYHPDYTVGKGISPFREENAPKSKLLFSFAMFLRREN